MEAYQYKPVHFYLLCYGATWSFWIPAAVVSRGDESGAMGLMFLGLLAPAVTAMLMVAVSGSKELKADLRDKLLGAYRITPSSIVLAVLGFLGIVVLSILLSLAFGQSLDQFAFTEEFSFAGGGAAALRTIVLAAVIEELGWRGYGEDAVASYCSWFKESILFGLVWALWHLPLFWIQGSYQHGLRELGLIYVLNFLFSVVPLGFLTTWVYVRNHRSMLASMLFHFFVNIMQEKIAMTPQTKCVETLVVTAAAVWVVWRNQEMFFEREHIGNLLADRGRGKAQEGSSVASQ